MKTRFLKKLFCGVLAITFLSSSFALSACAPSGGETPPQTISDEDSEEMKLSANGGIYAKSFTLYAKPSKAANTLYYSVNGENPLKSKQVFPEKGLDIASVVQKYDYPLRKGINNLGYATRRVSTGVTFRFSERDSSGKEVLSKTVSYVIDADYASLPESSKVPVVFLTADKEVWLGDGRSVGFYEDVTNDERKERMEIEYYDASTNENFAFNTQVKLGGNWTKYNFPKRTLNLNWKWADEAHTAKNPKLSKLGVHLFGKDAKAQDGSPLQNVTKVRLHSSGNAFILTGFNDAIAQGISEADENVSTAATRPCLLYLNGEFWGYYTIREHYSEDYFENNFSVDKDNVIYCDKTTALDQTARYGFNVKSFNEEDKVTINHREWRKIDYSYACLDELFSTLLGDGKGVFGSGFVSSELIADFAREPARYEKFLSLVDKDSLIDMVLIQAYAGNWDFFYNNMRMWRVADPSKEDPSNPYADGKWRFCLHDLDFSFEDYSGTVNIANGNVLESYTGLNGAFNFTSGPHPAVVTCLLEAPMRNSSFRKEFSLREKEVKKIFAYHEGSNAQKVYSTFKNTFEPYKKMEYSRWVMNGWAHNQEQYETLINWMEEVLINRGAVFEEQVNKFIADYANLYP